MLTKSFLEQEYIKNKKPLQCILQIAKCSIGYFYDCLKFHKIKPNRIIRDGRYSKIYYCINCNKEISYVTWRIGSKKCAPCVHTGIKRPYVSGTKHCKFWLGKKRPTISKRLKKLWKTKKYRMQILHTVSPNKKEILLYTILKQLSKNKYRLNIKGIYSINGKIPDFIAIKQKKIIELFGDYWHSKEWIKKRGCKEDTEKGRIHYFRKFGYKTLIVWEHELKDIDKLIIKLEEFNDK